MAEAPTYQIVLIPKLTEEDSHVKTLAEKFRAFRLHSLQVAPDAFASTYEAESQRGLEQSIARLTNHKAAQFIALRSAARLDGVSEIELLLDCEWVGMVVLLGPEEGDEFSIPSANIDPFAQMTASAPSYYSTRLFVSPKSISRLQDTYVSFREYRH